MNPDLSQTSCSQVRNDRFREAIQLHLLLALAPEHISVIEDTVIEGIESATKLMLSMGVLRRLQHVQDYLLLLGQVNAHYSHVW